MKCPTCGHAIQEARRRDPDERPQFPPMRTTVIKGRMTIGAQSVPGRMSFTVLERKG